MELLSLQTLTAIGVTLRLAIITTFILLVLGIPLAWWLARSKSLWSEVVATIVAMPLILPPTVLGFYLLIALGPNGFIGWVAPLFSMRTFAFSFTGLVIGSLIYSLPFVVQPVRNAFFAIGERPLEVAATLRRTPWQAFWGVALPLARPGILTGAVLGFAHTIGEYGVVSMIGGNTPQTRVISTTMVQLNENQQFYEANILAILMVVFAFSVILIIMMIDKKKAAKS